MGVLLAGGLLLANLFDSYVERSFETRLAAELDGLIAATELDPAGTPTLARALIDPLFQQVYSGRYWQISGPAGGALLRSRSLFDQELTLASVGGSADLHRHDATGPEAQSLRLLERHVTLPEAEGVFRFAVAADLAELQKEKRSFGLALVWSLGGLGLGLILAVIVQVRYGLRPLRRLGQALADIRAGRTETMAEDYPTEVMPLVSELNALLAHNDEVVTRARTHVGNLAHALKTPLTVLSNEADRDHPQAATVAKQTEIMRQQVERYLARARAAATGGVLGARTPLRPVAEDLARTLARIHVEKPLDFAIDIPDDTGMAFRGERQDLEEMLGNLMDNACKWAAGRVRLTAAVATGVLKITVEDDGPGLLASERATALKRGRRLDEAVPGSGLGLAIVQDIAGLYGGALALGDSALGGLAVTLDVPAALGEADQEDVS